MYFVANEVTIKTSENLNRKCDYAGLNSIADEVVCLWQLNIFSNSILIVYANR